MKEPIEFRMFHEIRSQTLSFAQSFPTEWIDIVPEGFTNSIRWNLGHILVGWDHGIFPKLGEEWRVPKIYHYTFPRGTSPSVWKVEPPAIQEIISKLEGQEAVIIQACSGKLDELIAQPFMRIIRLRGMFKFHNKEEQFHLDHMRRIKQAIE